MKANAHDDDDGDDYDYDGDDYDGDGDDCDGDDCGGNNSYSEHLIQYSSKIMKTFKTNFLIENNPK